MSLVNDMLRDLDQRRRTTDISRTTSVKLNPAVEEKRGNRRKLVVAVTGALVLAILLGFAWLQAFQRGMESREVSMPPQPLAESPPETSPEPVDLETLIRQQEQAAIAQGQVQAGPANEDPSQTTGRAGSEDNPTGADAAAGGAAESTAATPAGTFHRESARVSDQASTGGPEAPLLESAAREEVIIDGDGLRPEASVKSVTELSPEQRDAANAQQALRLYNDNRIDAAFALLYGYINANREAHQSRETFAKLLMQQGAGADAMTVIDEGLQISPNNPGFKKVKARLLMADRQLGAAVELLTARAPMLRNDVEYYELLASAQLANGEFQNATVTYTSLLRHDQTQGRWWYGLGAAYDGLDNQRAARQAYSRALDHNNLSAGLRQQTQRRLLALSP